MVSDELQKMVELAGMSDENGKIARSLLPGKHMIPGHVEICDEMLVWSADINWKDTTREFLPRYVSAEGPILDQFARLTVQKPDEIVRFAERWGVFDRPEDRTRDEGPDGIYPPYQGKEPLAMWGALATQVYAVLRIAMNLHQGTRTDPGDWQIALTKGMVRADAADTLKRRESDPRFCHPWIEQSALENIVQGWLDGTNVRPKLRWTAADPAEVTLQGHGVGGAIAVQLMAAVAKAEGIMLCSACGGPYTPERRPRPGRRYCPPCRNAKVPQRDAARALRERKNAQKRQE